MVYTPYIMLRGKYPFRRMETASGTRNFFRNGYPYHRWWPWRLGLDFRQCGDVAKTTTLHKHGGNMPMQQRDDIMPKEMFPRCIYVNPWHGDALNCVGLSGPGADSLLRRNIWQQMRGDPGWLSFMPIEQTAQERLDELHDYVALLFKYRIHEWNLAFGLELNVSCPNVETSFGADFVTEVCDMVSVADMLGIPLRLKANALLDHAAALKIFEHPALDALTMGNTIAFGQMADRIPYREMFGDTSPLSLRGFPVPGGYSGRYLRPINCDWIAQARMFGLKTAIWGCGGIRRKHDLEDYAKAGADGAQIASMTMRFPYNVRSTIRYGHAIRFDRARFTK